MSNPGTEPLDGGANCLGRPLGWKVLHKPLKMGSCQGKGDLGKMDSLPGLAKAGSGRRSRRGGARGKGRVMLELDSISRALQR